MNSEITKRMGPDIRVTRQIPGFPDLSHGVCRSAKSSPTSKTTRDDANCRRLFSQITDEAEVGARPERRRITFAT